MSRIFYTKPSITDLEVSYAADAAKVGWGDKCYAYIARFEKLFEEHLGVKHAIATSSCTGALHIAMSTLGVGPGDQVILGDTNWIASAAPITYLGAEPVFVDVLSDSWCLDPAKVRAAIGPKTKAIVAVHLYGNLCLMDELLAISREFDLPIIEDAAEAIGSEWKGRAAGTMGAFGTFSFHGTKTVTTGEGGMLVTNDSELYARALTLSNHGREQGQVRQFWPELVGFKYKMSNLEAAIGCAQLERIDELIGRKREIFLAYQAALADLPLRMNPEPSGTQNGYWMPTIVVDEDRAFNLQALLDDFKANDIDGRVFFWPLSSLPMFTPQTQNNVSYSLSSRACNLPSYHDMTTQDIERVCAVVRSHILKA